MGSEEDDVLHELVVEGGLRRGGEEVEEGESWWEGGGEKGGTCVGDGKWQGGGWLGSSQLVPRPWCLSITILGLVPPFIHPLPSFISP